MKQKTFPDLFFEIYRNPSRLAIISFILALLMPVLPFVFINGLYDPELRTSQTTDGNISGFALLGWASLLPILGYGFAFLTYKNSDFSAYQSLAKISAIAISAGVLIWAVLWVDLQTIVKVMSNLTTQNNMRGSRAYFSTIPNLGLFAFIIPPLLAGVSLRATK